MLSKKQITILHVAKSKLGWDDDTYRDVLFANAGVRSAKSLDYKGFLAVMEHFKVCGFTVNGRRRKTDDGKNTNGGPRSSVGGRSPRPGMATDAQLRKIKAVWLTLAGSYYTLGQEWRALRGFLKKRFRVEHENFLTFEVAWQVIEAVKKIGQRSGAKRLEERPGRDLREEGKTRDQGSA